jgi:hypothetical protein
MHKLQLVEFDGNINAETKENIAKQFSTVTPFEFDEEYIILHLEKIISSESEFVQFEIQDILAIYPLSQRAKASIESKIDQRIRLENPIFETVLPSIETEIEKKEVEKAISALWTICKIESPKDKYIDEIGLENIHKGLEYRRTGTKANKIQGGNYWEYLISYDYFQYFPEGIIRHFYQLGEVFSYYKGKIDGIEGTKIEILLKQIGHGNFEQLLQKFSNESLPQSFVDSMQEIGKSKFNPIVVSVLFLKWKTDLSNQDTEVTKSSIYHNGKIAFIDKYPNEVKLALILLGAFFGYNKFYDSYYEALNLRFYKSYREPKKEIESKERWVNKVPKTPEEPKIVEIETSDNKSEEPITTIMPEPIKNSHSGKGSQRHKPDILNQYQSIIEEALAKRAEIKLSDIVPMVKERTGKKITNDVIKKVLSQMKGVEMTKIGKADSVKKISGMFKE